MNEVELCYQPIEGFLRVLAEKMLKFSDTFSLNEEGEAQIAYVDDWVKRLHIYAEKAPGLGDGERSNLRFLAANLIRQVTTGDSPFADERTSCVTWKEYLHGVADIVRDA